MLTDKLVKELNTQINNELQSAYLYLSMAVYCDSRSLDGFSNWFMVQAQEETQHALKIYGYLRDLGAPATLEAIAQPPSDFRSLEDVFERTVQNEKEVTESINSIASHALAESDQMTYSFLKWFLDEQIEEIALSTSVLDKLRLVGDSGHGLFMLNDELGRRALGDEAA